MPQKKNDLLDRYLNAIKFWLPSGQQKDIIAEIAEDLHSQIDERETALGHLDELGSVHLVSSVWNHHPRWFTGDSIACLASLVKWLYW